MALPKEIRFCTSADGTRLAYSVGGSGPLLLVLSVLGGNPLEGSDSLTSAWYEALSQFRCIRYETRGWGLSQRDPPAFTMDAQLEDMDAVTDAAGASAFSILAFSNAVPQALHYAATRPQRVQRLAVYGGYTRGRRRRASNFLEERAVTVAQQMVTVAQSTEGGLGAMFRWAAYRQVFPAASDAFCREIDVGVVARLSADAAAAYAKLLLDEDARDAAQAVACPTLVLHAQRDRYTPVAEGVLLASLVPGARFVAVDSENHVTLPDEACWPIVTSEICRFLGVEPGRGVALTSRQREVLLLVRSGRTDKEIARELGLSPRTVEMHMARALQALACSNRTEAVHRATTQGLLTPDEG